jgi:formylglycine-generating enzyme required for sulfatase activity
MHGNVWEWCLDGRGDGAEDTYKDGVVDPPRSVGGPLRVNRGGSWCDSAQYARSAVRLCLEPGGANYDLGFRPALAARSDVK